MKKLFLFCLSLSLSSLLVLTAQSHTLTVRETLMTSLLSSDKKFTNANQRDTINISIPSYSSEYSLEVKARVASSTGRGLDIEARDSLGQGFRTSINSGSLNWSSSLSDIQSLYYADYTKEHTFRYAVKDGYVHIYQDNSFLTSKALDIIKNINHTDQEENPFSYGNDIAETWEGSGGSGKPTAYNWSNSAIDNSNSLWNTANGSGGIRYIDVTGSSSPIHTLNGSTYSSRLLVVRYEGELASSVYSYPVTLEANTAYEFSFIHEHWNNGEIGAIITAGISKSRSEAGYQTASFTTTTKNVLQEATFRFVSQEAGQYYITFTGAANTMFAVGNLSLKSYSKLAPRFVFGKNYTNGDVDMTITSITFDNGAYAPVESLSDLLINNQKYTVEYLNNKSVVLQGNSELILSGTTPLNNSTIDLQSEDSWVFFNEVRPSVVESNYLPSITVNGAPFVNGTNGRVAIYLHGTVIMPHSSNFKPLTVYTGENYEGESLQCNVHTYYNSLGSFDNKIKSFKLKRGYAVTFANNSDGTGYSRMFTADNEDIEISVMPDFLNETVSFIRVFKYNWVNKKGWGGDQTYAGYLDCTWNYDWSAGGSTSINIEYVPHKHQMYWPGWGLNDMKNITHVLGLNEPDRSDQANVSYEEVMSIMPNFHNSGLRITSPVTSDFYNSWGEAAFIRECDTLNYRVDIANVHAYQTVGWWSAGTMSDISSRSNNRPIWITEWNNGANWTTETWPSGNRLATDLNVQKQLANIKTILSVLDNHPKVERYAFYNWVEDCRALVLTINDTWKNNNPDWENYQWLKTATVVSENSSSKIVLTPAGEYYKNNKPPVAYNSANAKIPDWHVPYIEISSELVSDNEHLQLNWKPINDELIGSYTVEIKKQGESVFSDLITFTSAETVHQVVLFDKAQYRLRVNAAKSADYRYSNTVTGTKDPNLSAPVLNGEVVSISILNLTWNATENVRSYKLLRSKERDANYVAIASDIKTSTTSYQDTGLEENTTYFYKIVAINYAGEFESEVVELKTKELTLPEAVEGIIIYSSDSKITLNWDYMYDVTYKVLRSESSDGEYTVIATNVLATKWVDKGLENGKTYFYKILAVNQKGESNNASIVTGTPKEGLQAYFNFEEASGTTAYDQWGGNHGTLMSGADRRPGKIGSKSLSLDGTVNSYLQLPNGIVSDLKNFTITTWILLTSNNENNCIFSFGNSTSQYMMLSPNAGNNKIRFKFISGTMDVTFDVTKELPLTTWTHLAVKKSGTSMSLYVNGVLAATNNSIVLLPYAMGNTTQNYIGKSQSTSHPIFNGRIDDFRIYNYGLSDSEILCAMNNTDCSVNNSNETIQSEMDWSAYPNPTADVLHIDFHNNALIDNLSIYNISGQKVMQITTAEKQNAISIKTTDLPTGIYFLHVECEGNRFIKRIVKK